MILQATTEDLLRRVREHNCSRSKTQLLEMYLYDAIVWAKKLISSTVYSDLIDAGDGEIMSLVYMAFEKTVKHYKISNHREPNKTYMSFKNYLYYFIKFQTFEELRTTLNSRVIKGFDEIKKDCILKNRSEESYEEGLIKRTEIDRLKNMIEDFLMTRSEVYAKIYRLKINGFSNTHIQIFLRINPMTLKARLQYIKKLIREKFSTDPAFEIVLRKI